MNLRSDNIKNGLRNNEPNLVDEFLRYSSFWIYFLISLVFFVFCFFAFIRYSDKIYVSTAHIEIIDKAQDSEMALPTAMTVFNRSMINLDNEIGVLGSTTLHTRSVKKLKSNVKFFSSGNIKTTQNHREEWISDYDLTFNFNSDTVQKQINYSFEYNNLKLTIRQISDDDDILKSFIFNSNTTKESKHNLPFEFTINKDLSINNKILKILNFNDTVDYFKKNTDILTAGDKSDQLYVSMRHVNPIISDEYINTLISEFDLDGIKDRQLEYKNTIDFVDARSEILSKELSTIETRKQTFKEKYQLSSIEFDAQITINEQFMYDSELFKAKSQSDLILLFLESLSENSYSLMPIEIGIENESLNTLILEYNTLIKDRQRFVSNSGPNNPFVKNIEYDLDKIFQNVINSANNFKNSLDLNISNLSAKELDYEKNYKNIPQNEKVLRSIERELEVKEALFLLLLQKREEASINFAVIKPSIKIIDIARNNGFQVYPNKILFFIAFVLIGFFVPFSFLYIWFLFDNKIHTRKDLNIALSSLPIIGEIPHISNKENLNTIYSRESRAPLVESMRMIISNLKFLLFNSEDKEEIKNNVILVTSTIKGEGKTLVSVNLSNILSFSYNKILLIGSDLRNPQIHKFFNVDKSTQGLSDFIFSDDKNWKDLLIKNKNCDILFSGTIPPNPTEMLSSVKFKKLIDEVKNLYDFVIIDSAPCLLVSDTMEISKLADTTIYVTRSNFTDKNLIPFIYDLHNNNKFNGMSLVLNSVGNSGAYGYKYGYQYGYNYSYNYGYGYGYSEDKK